MQLLLLLKLHCSPSRNLLRTTKACGERPATIDLCIIGPPWGLHFDLLFRWSIKLSGDRTKALYSFSSYFHSHLFSLCSELSKRLYVKLHSRRWIGWDLAPIRNVSRLGKTALVQLPSIWPLVIDLDEGRLLVFRLQIIRRLH